MENTNLSDLAYSLKKVTIFFKPIDILINGLQFHIGQAKCQLVPLNFQINNKLWDLTKLTVISQHDQKELSWYLFLVF